MSEKPIGVIGAGSFGTTVANLLAENSQVLIYARSKELFTQMSTKGKSRDYLLHENVVPVETLEELATKTEIIFPVVSSSGFRSMMKDVAPYLYPYHTLIHGTKGLDVLLPDGVSIGDTDVIINRDNVKTMSEVILEESAVVKVGCLAGPNLAREIADKHPAATVVASRFDSVIADGQKLLRNDRFQVYGNKDLIGIELTGVLKNIIAIASGALSGLGYGENARALLVSRGMVEMIHLGKALGGNTEAFIGLAGIGDLIATCSSNLSRNFTVGYRLAKGETLSEISSSMQEVAEGVNTIRIINNFAKYYQFRAPITEKLHQVLFGQATMEEALQYLMKIPLNVDIDFL
jgi:glycerol-3-phosphate dehydrogenase (NAD(P)+)